MTQHVKSGQSGGVEVSSPTAVYWISSASRERVWQVLANGWFFGMWVVGATRIRAVDAHWPQPGTRIHHSIGLWPLMLDDHTVVVTSIADRELSLMANAWPLGQAEIVIRLHTAEEGGCRIEMSETAASFPFSLVPESLQALAVRPRNRECLRRLALLAEHRPDA